MCGICGIGYIDKNRQIERKTLERMNEVLSHRGSDDEGIYIDGNVGLGVKRLSIIDLKTGHQPIHNENKSIWIVFNGEIYNYKELRRELEEKGHQFYTQSDTEVIIHLYEDYGEDCVHHLNGMFAFAIWDSKGKKLFLARDRLGIKPLFYRIKEGVFLFGSEIKSILQYPKLEREINFKALDNYLTYLYIPGPETIFQGIYKLPPGYVLTYNFKDNKVLLKSYWDLNYVESEKKAEGYYSERLLELLKESVKGRLMSEVPLGVFLSGGMDSSTIVALMSELQIEPIRTFSVGFDAQSYNELKFARIIAKRFNTDHQEFEVKPNVLELLPKIVWHFDEPFADSSSIPTYMISELAREYAMVILSGDGGDELFAGYAWTRTHQFIQYYQKIPKIFRRLVERSLLGNSFIPDRKAMFLDRVKRFIYDCSLPEEKSFFRRITCFTPQMKENLYSKTLKEYLRDNNSYERVEDIMAKDNIKNFENKMLYVDTKFYLPDDGLCKVDRMSMANSLEVRVPFLDHRLVEFAASIPFEYKLRNLTTKYILKKTVSKMLPPEIVKQRKQGFSLPISQWFRGDLKNSLEKILLSEKSKKRDFFNLDYIKWLLEENSSGRQQVGHQIYALLVFEIWAQLYLDRNIYQEPKVTLTDF